jgi:hypothetical protein
MAGLGPPSPSIRIGVNSDDLSRSVESRFAPARPDWRIAALVKRATTSHGVVQTSLFNIADRTEAARMGFDLSRCEFRKLAGLKASRLRDQKP